MTNQEKNLIVKMAIKRERDLTIKALENNKEVKGEEFEEIKETLNLELTNQISVLDEVMSINVFPDADLQEIKNSKHAKVVN